MDGPLFVFSPFGPGATDSHTLAARRRRSFGGTCLQHRIQRGSPHPLKWKPPKELEPVRLPFFTGLTQAPSPYVFCNFFADRTS
jgi:hypothetical protein